MKQLNSLLLLEPYIIYKKFIDECRCKIYDENLNLQKHHIIPKHLNGTDDISNLVMLSIDDHVTAHLLLAECFEESSYEKKANLWSARIIKGLTPRTKEEKDHIRKMYIGENNPFYGRTHTKENREKIAERNKKKKGIKYESLYGEEESIRQKEKRSLASKKYWENVSIEERKKRSNSISKSLKGKGTGSDNNFSRPLLVDGIRYETTKDAMNSLGYKYYKQLYGGNHTVIKLEKNDKRSN